jgi:hypothetical protein
MTRAVLASHLAGISVASPRGEAPRNAHVRAETPILLAQAEVDEFERPGPYRTFDLHGRLIEPWIRDGVAWHPLRHAAEGNARWGEAVTADELVSWLSGMSEPGSSLSTGMERSLSGTPFAPRPFGHVAGQGPRERGAPADVARGAALAADDRAACAEEVRRIARDEILVAGGTALVRLRPMVRFLLRGTAADEVLTLTPEASAAEPVLRFADRPRGGSVMRVKGRIEYSGSFAEMRQALPGLDDGEDLRIMANVLPAAVRLALEPLAAGRIPLGFNKDIGSVRAADAAIAELGRRGAYGLVGRDELPAAYEVLWRGARLSNQSAEGKIPGTRYRVFDRAMTYMERVALPRVLGPIPEDDHALEGLAP